MSIDKTQHFAHHFKSAEHEHATGKEGVWLFLTSEVLMFGALFVAFIIYNTIYPEVFTEGAKHLDWRLGALNTVVLLTSSLTMVLAISALQNDKPNLAITHLLVTFTCAMIFMVVKYFEYTHKFHEGLFPGEWFRGDTHGIHNLGLYFSFYFMMTGLHGIHVMAGALLMLWLAYRTKRGDFSSKYYITVEGVGLFWHLVDLIWIFLFPLLYLVE
jgi:cytochrome c oxidase subunit III